MLATRKAAPTLAVRDLARARRFYEGVLGLSPLFEMEGAMVQYAGGGTPIQVYVSSYAGTNQATAVTWDVPDVDGTVRALRDRGVRFEHYDLPDTRLEGDVHVGQGQRVAWFKDPDGNIHCLANHGG